MTDEPGSPDSWQERATQLLQQAGSPQFGEILSRHALQEKPIDFFVLNLHDAQYRLIERLGELTERQRLVADTVDRHATFRFDPNSKLVQRIRNPHARVYVNRVHFDDTRQKRFHDLFHQRFNLIDRVSVISALGKHWLVSGFYRTRDSGAFTPDEAEDIIAFGEWTNSLAALHLRSRLSAQLASTDVQQARQALSLAFSELSSRELDVAARLITGMGNADVARSLDVALETVRTLRRRLRQKSGCSDTADLVRQALNRLA